MGKYKDFGIVYHDLYFFSEDFDLEHVNSDGTTETRHFKKDKAYGLDYTWNNKINYVEFEDNVILNGDDVYEGKTYYSRSIYTVSKNEDGDYEIQLVSDENDRYRVQSLALNNLTKDIKKYDYFYGVLKKIDGVFTYVYAKDEFSGITTGQEGTAFLGCSDEIRRQVPIYLGGTKPNPVVSLPLSGMSIDLDSENLTSTLGLIFETLGAKVEN